MRYSTPALTLAMLAPLALPGAAAASAPAMTTARLTTCIASAESVRVSPGLGTTPATGTFKSVDRGHVECDGPINGQTPTGPGTWSTKGRYGVNDPDTCLAGGDGTFVHKFVLPSKNGPIRFGNTGTFTYGGLHRAFSGGEFTGKTADGLQVLRPVKGDCVTTPISEVSAVLTFRMKN